MFYSLIFAPFFDVDKFIESTKKTGKKLYDKEKKLLNKGLEKQVRQLGEKSIQVLNDKGKDLIDAVLPEKIVKRKK